MKPLVIDASAVAAWAFKELRTSATLTVLRQLEDRELLAPSLFPLEVCNMLLVAERRGRLAHGEARSFFDRLLKLNLTLVEIGLEDGVNTVFDLARTHGLTSYDASYLRVALAGGFPLATRDEKLIVAAAKVGVELVAV